MTFSVHQMDFMKPVEGLPRDAPVSMTEELNVGTGKKRLYSISFSIHP